MHDRLIGSLLVVVLGLLPVFIGGPVFALLMIALGIAGYREFLHLTASDANATVPFSTMGAVLVAATGLAALLSSDAVILFAIAFAAIAIPLVALLPQSRTEGALGLWAFVCTGLFYLALPVYAAVALRSLPGTISAPALADLAATLSFGWAPAPLGLAWTLTVVLATWLGDSAAYLVGRAVGRAKLAPYLSPNKTVAGAIGGLAASTLAGALAFTAFGVAGWLLGAMVGAVIGVAGQSGDLAESFLKRQAGVKDSGSLIPGHGGVLDRIDALLFAFPVSYVLVAVLEKMGIA